MFVSEVNSVREKDKHMSNWKQGSARSERKKQERRKKREIRKRESTPIKLPLKLLDRLDEAYSLIQSSEYAEAEALLIPLDRPGSGICGR